MVQALHIHHTKGLNLGGAKEKNLYNFPNLRAFYNFLPIRLTFSPKYALLMSRSTLPQREKFIKEGGEQLDRAIAILVLLIMGFMTFGIAVMPAETYGEFFSRWANPGPRAITLLLGSIMLGLGFFLNNIRK